MHAVIYQVDVKPDWEGDVDAELDFVVKLSQDTAGFIRGTWLGNTNGEDAISIQLFETEAQARATVENAFVPPEASVTLRSASVYEVVREAP